MRLTRRFGFLLLLAIFVHFPSRSAFTSRTKSPQGFYTGSITINVRTGKFPISGARVKVVRVISLSSTNIRMETFKGRTNRYGEYHLGGLRTGTYSIHVEVPGYSPQVDEVVVGPNLTKSLS